MDILQHPIFKAAFETPVPQVILQSNIPVFTIVAYNRAYARSTRSENTDLVGQNLFSAFDPSLNGTEGDAIAQRGFIEAIQKREIVYIPPHRYNLYSEVTRRIEEHWWEAEVKPVILDNEVKYIHVSMQEITDRILTGQVKVSDDVSMEYQSEKWDEDGDQDTLTKKKQQAEKTFPDTVFRSERHFSDLLNAIPAIAWTSNTAGGVTFYNQRWYDYTGLDFEQTKSWGWKTVIHPDDIDYNLRMLAEIWESKQEGSFEIREKGTDGIYRWHLVRISPMRDDRGEIMMWVGTAVDIQALKEVQQQKDEFLSIASHELKTPLTSIKAFNQLMLKADGEAKLKNFAEKSATHIKRLEKLISNLLDVSRINAGKMIYESADFSFEEMLRESVDNVQLTSPDHELIITESANITYHGDRLRLEQVMNNLLSNAVKYSPEGGKVIVSSNIVQNGLVVSVHDHGIGIEAKHLNKLFDRYYRIDNTAMRFEGLGLGLFIASEIIRRHKGSLWIESEPGKGSTFFFRLPLETVNNPLKDDKSHYYRNRHATICYNNEKRQVEVKWHGFQNLDSIKLVCGQLLQMAVKNNATKLLADNTGVEGDWSEATEWVSNVNYPRMEQAGIKTIAWIESQSSFSRLAAQKSIELVNGAIVTKFFTQQSEAEQWLHNC